MTLAVRVLARTIEVLDRFATVAGDVQRIENAGVLERTLDEHDVILIVFDEQDGLAGNVHVMPPPI
ncbi:hypothetical protein D3C83_196120 [compost metagenome]